MRSIGILKINESHLLACSLHHKKETDIENSIIEVVTEQYQTCSLLFVFAFTLFLLIFMLDFYRVSSVIYIFGRTHNFETRTVEKNQFN